MLFCVLSAIAYTAYNVCLRGVSELYDAAWINCVQASVGTTVFGVYLAWRAVCGRPALPPSKELLALVVIGLITQLGGVLFIWGMAVVGVAVAATLQMGVMLAASAVLGWMALRETVTPRQWGAIALITISVVLFSRGSQSVGENPAETPGAATSTLEDVKVSQAAPQEAASPLRILCGVIASVLAGVAFAILTVGIRKTVGEDASPEAIVFLINAAGVVFLAPWCVASLGLPALAQTAGRHLAVMLAAGLMNLFGFLLITLSLQRITVVRANVVNNAATMALTVIAGIALFREPWNGEIALGMLLAAVGAVIISLQPAQEAGTEATIEPCGTLALEKEQS